MKSMLKLARLEEKVFRCQGGREGKEDASAARPSSKPSPSFRLSPSNHHPPLLRSLFPSETSTAPPSSSLIREKED